MSTASSVEFRASYTSNAPQCSCDLCLSTESIVVRNDPNDYGRIVLCKNCHLMYRDPRMDPEALDSFYEDTFENDPGCRMRAGENFATEKDRKKEETLAENWGIKIIKRHLDPRGKKILDLRCRTGALTALLIKEGAEVIGTEPFQANAEFARQVRNLPNILDLPFSRFDQFPLPPENSFDAINVLGHHVLAHVISPRILLNRIYEVLNPGGYLFLDEKDVLLPARHKKQSPLDSGPAHQYHLTLHTTGCYVQSSGFELLECAIDQYRSSDFRHIRIVARKPKTTSSSSKPKSNIIPGKRSPEAIQRRLSWLGHTWRIRLKKEHFKRKFHRKLQKWGLQRTQ